MENRLKMLLIKAFGGYPQAEQWDRADDGLRLAEREGFYYRRYCELPMKPTLR